MKQRNAFLTMAVLLSLSGHAFAAEDTGAVDAPIRLQDSVVRAEYMDVEKLRDTKEVIVIDKKEIQDRGYKTVSDILKDQPSISVGAAGWGQIDIRGQGSDQATRNIQVLVDGAPITTMVNHPMPNNYDYVPVEQIEKIEIIPGGGSVIYGSGAAGGIINITTNLRNLKKPNNSVTSEWNSDGFRTGFHVGGKPSEKLTLQVGANRTKRDLYFDNTFRNSDYIYGALRYDPAEQTSVTFRFSDLNEESKFLQNVTRRYVEQYGRHYQAGRYLDGDRDMRTYNVTMNHAFSPKVSLQSDIFYTEGNYMNMNPRTVNGRMKHKSYGTRTKVDFKYSERDSILVGVDYIEQKSHLNYPSGTKILSFDYDKQTSALYALNKMKRGKFTFTQGVRREDLRYAFDKDGGSASRPIGGSAVSDRWNTAVEASVGYQYASLGNVFLRYERGFTSPDGLQIADEVYSSPSRKVYAATSANEERYHIWEAGLRDKIGVSTVQLTLFASETNNELDRPYFRGPNGYEYRTYNMYNTKRQGYDVTLSQRLGKLSLKEGYAYLHGERDYTSHARDLFAQYAQNAFDFTNSGLKSVPKHKFTMQADYRFDEKWSANASYVFYGKYNNFIYDKNRNDKGSELPSYGLLNVSFRYKQNDALSWYAGVTNLLGKDYVEYGSTSISTIIPGMPRTYFGGLKVSF